MLGRRNTFDERVPSPPPSYDETARTITQDPTSSAIQSTTGPESRGAVNESVGPERTQRDPETSERRPSQPSPVILLWDPSHEQSVVQGTTPSAAGSSRINRQQANPQVPRDHSLKFIYTFSQLSHNSVLLLPSPDAAESQPKYHISTALNMFYPMNWTTTIRKGGSEQGQFVGGFYIGTPAMGSARSGDPSTVRFGATSMDMEDAVHVYPGATVVSWKALRRRKLRWRRNSMTSKAWTCEICPTGESEGQVIATLKAVGSWEVQPSTLHVSELGNKLLDEVVISCLLCEYHRMARRPKA